MKIVIFHPAIAPYRIDFFNSLHEVFNVSFYFEHQSALEQPFDQKELNKRIKFTYSFLKQGIWGVKNLRLSILSILKQENPDIVFISEYNLLGFLVLLYKLCFNWQLKIVVTCDDNIEMVQSVSFVKKQMRAILLRNTDLVLLVNKQVQKWYKKHLSLRASYFCFPIIQSNVLFRERLQKAIPLSIQLNIQYGLQNKKVILYVGRLVQVKNVSLLISVFKHLHQYNKDCKLILVGEGEEETILKQQAGSLINTGFVIFAGKKEGKELMPYYNLGDVFVLPSQYEPFGTVVNEALLSGCFTICSDVAGASCLIENGYNGFVFKSNDFEMLLTYLTKALEKISPTHKQSILKPNRMLESYNDYYESFITELTKLTN